MRITNNLIVSNLLRDLQKNNYLMEKSNRRLSSGKDFRLPGENPVGTSKSMLLRTGLNTNSKFIKNMDEGIAWLEYTDDALGDVTELFIRARELAIYGANDIHDQTSRLGIAEEMDAIKNSIHMISNSDYAGRFIFSGEKTDTEPYRVDGSFYGNDNYFQMEIGPGNYLEINLPGSVVFGNNESIVPYSRESAISMLEIVSRDLREEGEIKNLAVSANSSLSMLNAEDLQKGHYSFTVTKDFSSGTAVDAQVIEQQNHLLAPQRPDSFFNGSIGATSTLVGGVPGNDSPYSGSLELEVLEVNPAADSLTVQMLGHLYDQEGNYYRVHEMIDLDMGALENGAIFSLGSDSLNGEDDFVLYSTVDRDGFADGEFQAGDTVILSLSSALSAGTGYDKMEVDFSTAGPGSSTFTYYFHSGALNDDFADENFDLYFQTLTQGVGHGFDGRLELRFAELESGTVTFDYEKGRVGDRIGIMDDFIDTLLTTRASLGGKVHRLELNKNYLESHELRLQSLLSVNEDADIAATILELKIQETIHRSALASGARIIQPSLIDFLR